MNTARIHLHENTLESRDACSLIIWKRPVSRLSPYSYLAHQMTMKGIVQEIKVTSRFLIFIRRMKLATDCGSMSIMQQLYNHPWNTSMNTF